MVYEAGFGFECVSPGELHHVISLFPAIDRATRILFTPNFAPREEYEEGFNLGVILTVDNVYPLKHWASIFKCDFSPHISIILLSPVFVFFSLFSVFLFIYFRGRNIFLRIDPGAGKGHHAHVKTGGKLSKFGIDLSSCDEVAALVQAAEATVTGLHAHVGSGILKEADNWLEVGTILHGLKASHFPKVEVLDLGGGLGVVQNPTQGRLFHINLLNCNAFHCFRTFWLN